MISIIYKDVNGNSASGAQDVAATRFGASRQKQAAAVVVADWRGTFISPAPQYTWLRIAKGCAHAFGHVPGLAERYGLPFARYQASSAAKTEESSWPGL